MPREQTEWSKKHSIDDEKQNIHAEQSCTYSSVININQSKDLCSSSYEHAQTWTLSRSLSNHHKRYQSVIENIHLTVPNENKSIPLTRDRSIAIFPSMVTTQKHVPSPTRTMIISHGQRGIAIESKNLPIKIVGTKTSHWNIAPTLIKPMRILRRNGEFIVRI